jgi:hypothetical protein
MKRNSVKLAVVFHVFVLGLAGLIAQQTPPPGGTSQDPQEAVAAPAAIAESGLLPVYGGTLQLDKTWVDGSAFPSEQPNFGVAQTLEDLYATQLLPCGFNVLRVDADLSDPSEGVRFANLAVWAQSKGLRIVPSLTPGPVGQTFPTDYPAKVKSFVSSLLSNLKKNEAANLPAYMQIAFYQLGHPLNSPASHGPVEPSAAAEALKQAAAELHAAEIESAGELGLSPSQVGVAASFDIELLKTGAIAGTALSPESFAQAFETLKNYLAPIAESPEVGMVIVEWLPGSVTAEATERLPDLVRGLLTDVQGKLIVLSTGYSTAFRPHEDQSRYYALAFSNVADVRAAEGVDSPFIGLLWNSTLNAADAEAAPPSEQTPQNIAGWDLAAKSAELIRHWESRGGDPDLSWWWAKTRSSFGILSSADGSFAPKQAHQVLAELQGATAAAAVESGIAETAQKLEEAQAQAAAANPSALPVDPNTGLPVDPNTGLPIDPNTGLPVDPNAGGALPAAPGANVMDELKNTLNGALSQLVSGIIEKGKESLGNLIGRLLGSTGAFPAGGPIDPNTGLPIDPNSGLPIDPNTGLPIDPNTGLPVDPNTGLPAGGAPGQPAPSGTADLAFESAPSVPTSLTTNEPLALSISIRNNGDSQAIGTTAYLVDQEGSAFAASENLTVDPGATVSATLSFLPPSAGSIPGVKVLLFCDNEANPADNESPVGTMTITDPAGGVPEPGAPDPGRGPIDLGKVRFQGIKPLLGITLRVPGIMPSLSRIKPGMFNVGALAPAAGAKLGQDDDDDLALTDLGSPLLKRLGFVSGQQLPLNVPVTNPFRKTFTNVRAQLFVDGKQVATRFLGTIMPKQTKTVSFNEFRPNAAGSFQAEVRFAANGPKGVLFQGRSGGQIHALDASKAKALLRPAVIPSALGRPNGPGTEGALKRLPRPLGGLAPKVVNTSLLKPISVPTARPGASSRPLTIPVVKTFAMSAAGAVSLLPDDIVVAPFPPAEGAMVATSIHLQNKGMAGLRGVKVEAFADGKSLGSQTLDVPAGREAVAARFQKFAATSGPHTVRAVVTVSGRAQEASRKFEVKKGVSLARPAIFIPIAPSVAFTGNDIQFAPVPQPSKPTAVLLNVRNPASGPASVEFEAFADGRSLGKVSRRIGPMQSANVSGFGPWTPTAGAHVVKIVASIGSRQVAAEKRVNVSTLAAMRPIVNPKTVTNPALIRPGAILNPGAGVRPGVRPGGTTPPILRPGGAVGPKNAPDLAVGVGDLSLSPSNPSSGQEVTIQVRVRNIGGVDANGATLTISYRIDAQEPRTLNLPISVKANSELSRSWKVRLGTGRSLAVAARVSHSADANNANATANKAFPLGGASLTPPVIRPGGIAPGGIRVPPPDIALSAADISFLPSSVKENDTLTFTIRVRNLGQGAGNGTRLKLTLNKDGAQHEVKEFVLNLAAGQVVNQTYAVRVPKARQLQLVAEVSHPTDANAANQKATATVNVAPSVTIRNPGLPGLALATPDLSLGVGSVVASPTSVRVGQSVRFTARVRNVGRAQAKSASLTIRVMVDGRLIRSQSFTIDVGGGATIERSLTVTVPAGRQVQCTASVSGGGDTNTRNNSGSASASIS